MNTGSPEAPTQEAVRKYLRQFLMDPQVIDLPFPFRYALVHGIILPRRPAQTAMEYQRIWTPNGSPLTTICKNIAQTLDVELGMTYGHPSYRTTVENLIAQGVEEIGLLPLFPQSAEATTGTCVSRIKKAIRGRVKLHVAPPFHRESVYIDAISESVRDIDEHLLFSYHGLPIRQLKKQPHPNYYEQCLATTRAIAKAAKIEQDHYHIAFQSRLGRTRWTEPYTEQVLQQLPAQGIKSLAVVCPGFLCDNLETLDEIAIRGKELFLKSGGETFRMIPCLNDSPAGLQCIKTLMDNAENWPKAE